MLSHWQQAALGSINVLLFFFWGLLLPGAYAQLSPQASIHLTMANGLPHNTIMGVEQDRAGFIWIATFDGLARYDGRDIKVFRHRPGDTLSLADNKIRDLQQAADGTIVVNTESGTVQQFDPATERFTTLLHRRVLEQHKAVVNEVELSADGNHLWDFCLAYGSSTTISDKKSYVSIRFLFS